MDRLQSSKPLHPFVALTSTIIVLVVGLFYAKHPLFYAYILGAIVIFTLFGFGKTVLKAVVILIPVSALFGLFSYLFQQDLTIALQMVGRVILMGLSAVPMLTLPPINLIRSLAKLRVPRIITLGMLIAIRFVPVVAAEVRRVREAMRTRGARGSFYRGFVIPVMIRLMNISDTMALSLETRAFSAGKEPVSVYKRVTFKLKDLLYCLIIAAAITCWVVFL